jgi:hypothetical protein
MLLKLTFFSISKFKPLLIVYVYMCLTYGNVIHWIFVPQINLSSMYPTKYYNCLQTLIPYPQVLCSLVFSPKGKHITFLWILLSTTILWFFLSLCARYIIDLCIASWLTSFSCIEWQFVFQAKKNWTIYWQKLHFSYLRVSYTSLFDDVCTYNTMAKN